MPNAKSSSLRAPRLNTRDFELQLDIGDVAVRFRASTKARLTAITRPTLGDSPSSRTASCDVSYVPRAPSAPPTQASTRIADVDLWQEGSSLYIEHVSGLRAWTTTTVAMIGGTDREGLLEQVLLPVVTHLLGHQNRYLIHAGAIAHDSAAYLVMGDTGSGKSTLALGAMTSGWRVLSDDLAILRRSASQVEVWGVPRPPSVPRDVASAVIPVGKTAPDVRERVTLSPDCLTRDWLPVRGVIVSGHATRAASYSRSAKTATIHEAAVRAFMSVSPLLLKRWLELLVDLNRFPAWQLLHGSDASSRLAGVGKLLRKVDAREGLRVPATDRG